MTFVFFALPEALAVTRGAGNVLLLVDTMLPRGNHTLQVRAVKLANVKSFVKFIPVSQNSVKKRMFFEPVREMDKLQRRGICFGIQRAKKDRSRNGPRFSVHEHSTEWDRESECTQNSVNLETQLQLKMSIIETQKQMKWRRKEKPSWSEAPRVRSVRYIREQKASLFWFWLVCNELSA